MKTVQGFTNSVTVKGGMRKAKITVMGCMEKFAAGGRLVLWVNGNLRMGAFDLSNLFES